MRVVAKFGGTSLGNGDRIERAADSIADVVAGGHQIAVVASAMGSTTDELLDSITFEAEEADRAEIVSMGERTSVRMLKAALSARDVNATFVEPGHPNWPIVTDEHGEVDVAETTRRAEKLAEKLDDTVPVITGFLAEDHEGNVTTLGRGGSDTTAVMLGNYLDADEVVIITDVEGVMTGDPGTVEGARNVGAITVDELRSLSFRGAEVIAPSALTYKNAGIEIRVIHYQHDDLLSGGTNVEGEFRNLVDLMEDRLACLTVAGRAIRNQPGVLRDLTAALAEGEVNVDAVASGMDSISFYVAAGACERAERILHRQVIDSEVLSSVSVNENIAAVRILGGEISAQHGVVRDITVPLAEAGVDVQDIVTSATSIAVFVDWNDRETGLDLIQEHFEEAPN
jgi:aspartate kinase